MTTDTLIEYWAVFIKINGRVTFKEFDYEKSARDYKLEKEGRLAGVKKNAEIWLQHGHYEGGSLLARTTPRSDLIPK